MPSHLSIVSEVIRSGIEILILSSGIYFTWKLFRGTRGARVLAGFGFLLAMLSLVSYAFRLTVIEKLLSFSPIFLLTSLVIIFNRSCAAFSRSWAAARSSARTGNRPR